MNVDFLITELNVGGAEKALTDLAIGMQQLGYGVRVLSIGSEPSADRHAFVDRLERERVPVEFGGFDHWSRLQSAKHWLTKKMRDVRPDLCQSFLFHANSLGTFAAQRAGVRLIVGGIRVAESNRIRCAIEKQAAKRMTHLACVSRQVKKFAIDHLAANPHRCSVIPNGVDVAKYRDALPLDWSEIGWPSDSRVAVFVGRFHRQKGIELIQQQCDELMGDTPERRILLIGDGPLRRSLTDWAKRIGTDRVQVLPWQRDVAPFLKAATFLILPSLYEGMANVVLESMAAGRPVVCSRVEGSEELLGAGPSSGIVGKSTDGKGIQRDVVQGFPVGDGRTMTRLADAFFRDAELCRMVGEANQRHVEKQFSISQMVERYAVLYESLSGGEPGG